MTILFGRKSDQFHQKIQWRVHASNRWLDEESHTKAVSKMARMLASDSPLTPAMTSVEVTSINGMSNSDAMACAKLVFPLPVGPKIKSPL